MSIEKVLEKHMECVPMGQRIIDVPRVDLQSAIIEIRKLNAIIKCDDKIIEDQVKSLTNTTDEADKLQKAIELLTECSSELFIKESNIVLEQKVDRFLNENQPQCCGACEGCNKNFPSSLKHQAD